MIKPTTKSIFLLKITLSVIIAKTTGELLALRAYPSVYPTENGRWVPAIISTFFVLSCIVILQWILLSDYLPKWWAITGFIGCVIAAFTIGAIHFFVPVETYRLYAQELNIFNYFLMGTLVALPQWFLLKRKRGYLWVLANGTGWLSSIIFGGMIFYPQVKDIFSLAVIRTIILETSTLPLGLLIGLYLYTYIYNSNNPQVVEDEND